jgi:hypothetical protein
MAGYFSPVVAGDGVSSGAAGAASPERSSLRRRFYYCFFFLAISRLRFSKL